MKLSIIIPAYNSEKFIEKCLLSCLNQDISHNEYEIIVVDDGSTDNTKNIVLSMKEKYNNIKYFYQDNAAQGAARNNGLSRAQGKYIWFVDSDDWITENCLGKIINKLEKYHFTAVLVGHATQHINYLDEWEKLDDNLMKSGKDLLLAQKLYLSPTYAIWEKKYLIDNKLVFKERLFHEDTELYPRLFYKASLIGAISDIFYFVYANPNSTTRGGNPKRSFDMIKVISYLNDFKKDVKEEKIKLFITNYICLNLNAALYNISLFNISCRKEFNLLLYHNKTLFNNLLHSNILKYKIEGILFILLPHKVTYIYKMMQLFNKAPGGIKKIQHV